MMSDVKPVVATTLVSNKYGSVLIGNQGNDTFELNKVGTSSAVMATTP